MTDYNQNQIEIMAERLANLQKRAQDYKFALNDFTRDLSILAREIADYSKTPLYRVKNRIICRIMNHFISRGVSVNDAMILTSARTHEDVRRIETVYQLDKQEIQVRERMAKIIMIKRLCALRYPKKEIARITGYSEKYIFDLMRQNHIKSR